MAGSHYTIPEMKAQLEQVRDELIRVVETMPEDRFFEGSETDWSAADYLKHLILAVKPFAKGLGFPPEQLERRFGKPENPSRSYEEFAVAYDTILASGVRAEMMPSILPAGYRVPEDVTDERAYLVATWRDAHERLFTAMDGWDEATLDQYQLPHPAVGNATLREMLYFTMHHNKMHTNDIARRGNLTPSPSP